MTISYHERPGVYSDYEASAVYPGAAQGKPVGLAAVSSVEPGLYTVRSGADAAAFAADAPLAAMLRLLLQNGAGEVLVCAIAAASTAAYTAAFSTILAQRRAKVLLSDTDDTAAAFAMKIAVEAASADRNECVGVFGMSETTDAARLATASALNSARMIAVAPKCYLGTTASAVYGAAAVAGLIAGQTDPALPFGGAVLAGIDGVEQVWTETALDALIRGGVTPLEYADGAVRIVRGVTTKSIENGVADATWREITTILSVDDVISGVRAALTRRFPRAKNNLQTRSAIRDQVIVELEDRLRREIIDSYGDLSVDANENDPTVCDVVFSFGVCHGLSHILLSAHITL